MTDSLVEAVAEVVRGHRHKVTNSNAIARAAIAAIEAQGWAIVPKEPTEKMLDAASHANNPHTVYWAMLSARPKQEPSP